MYRFVMKMEGSCRSLGSDGSVTALALVTDIGKFQSRGNDSYNAGSSKYIDGGCVTSNGDGIEGNCFALVGMCSKLLVIDASSGKIVASAVALPFGLRIHGIEWILWELDNNNDDGISSESLQSVLLAVHGRHCLTYWELKVRGSNGVELRKVCESRGIEKWIFNVSLTNLFSDDSKNRSVLATVGCIDNSVKLFHVNMLSEKASLLGHVQGESRCLLYSMDLFDYLEPNGVDQTKDIDDVGYTCQVAGGTILWDITVWKLKADIAVDEHGAIGVRAISIETLYRLKGHRGSIHCVRWGSSGRILASGSDDRLVKIWRLNEISDDRDGKNERNTTDASKELFGHKNRIWEIRFSSDDSLLFSGSEDGCLITWDLATSAHISQIKVVADSSPFRLING